MTPFFNVFFLILFVWEFNLISFIFLEAFFWLTGVHVIILPPEFHSGEIRPGKWGYGRGHWLMVGSSLYHLFSYAHHLWLLLFTFEFIAFDNWEKWRHSGNVRNSSQMGKKMPRQRSLVPKANESRKFRKKFPEKTISVNLHVCYGRNFVVRKL